MGLNGKWSTFLPVLLACKTADSLGLLNRSRRLLFQSVELKNAAKLKAAQFSISVTDLQDFFVASQLTAHSVVVLQIQLAHHTIHVLGVRQSLLQFLHSFPPFIGITLHVELGKAPLHHILHSQLLHSQQIQYHGVGQSETRLQLRWFALTKTRFWNNSALQAACILAHLPANKS